MEVFKLAIENTSPLLEVKPKRIGGATYQVPMEVRGERKLALRYEFTFQLKRLAQNKKLPFKRYQIGTVFRDEPVSQNRFREFTQCDTDIIGDASPEAAAGCA